MIDTESNKAVNDEKEIVIGFQDFTTDIFVYSQTVNENCDKALPIAQYELLPMALAEDSNLDLDEIMIVLQTLTMAKNLAFMSVNYFENITHIERALEIAAINDMNKAAEVNIVMSQHGLRKEIDETNKFENQNLDSWL
jgi:hypothetical protein